MTAAPAFALDVVIFGGGAAGLWLLDELTRAGLDCVLLEARELGRGQTACAQGIIHGGLKYTLDGIFSDSAEKIREMPAIWRECLAGARCPRLTGTRVRAEYCHLWRTGDLMSRIGMIGARAGLRIRPVRIQSGQRPALLRDCPGDVYRLDEQVIDPVSLVADLAAMHADRIRKIDWRGGVEAATERPGEVGLIGLTAATVLLAPRCELRPRWVVLCAGEGNAGLREMLGLSPAAMQRRPLHMLMVRGELPALNGHCTDGAHTRVTITSDVDGRGRIVWQVGGQISEDAVAMSPRELIAAGRRELAATIPGLDLERVEWSTYRVDRAEQATATGQRPSDVSCLIEGNVITAWPTKLALVPRLAEEICGQLLKTRAHDGTKAPGSSAVVDREHDAEAISGKDSRAAARRTDQGERLLAPNSALRTFLAAWPRPRVAPPPWEEDREWFSGL